jgi:hypothetical protein
MSEPQDRVRGIEPEGSVVIVSESPTGHLQIDVSTTDGGLVYIELSEDSALRLASIIEAKAIEIANDPKGDGR